MLTRSRAMLATMLASAGCYGRAAEPAPAARPAASPAIEAAGWPTRLEFRIDRKDDVVKRGSLAMVSIEATLPVFETDPPDIGAALNARIAKLAKPDLGPRTYEGRYSIECTVELANRYAVILDCYVQLDEQMLEESESEEEGSSSSYRHLAFGWWLRRGLPALSIEQFAPHFDLHAAIEAELSSQPPDCDLRSCGFHPRSFLIDGEGITPIATEECPSACEGAVPTVPLDRLAPAHAWAEELVKRVRRRVEAGDGLVEGDRSY